MKTETAVCVLGALLAWAPSTSLAQNQRNSVPSAPTGNAVQFKSEVDVRSYGVDCTGHRDSSAALNAAFSNITGKHVVFPTDPPCTLRVDSTVTIFGQSYFVLDGGGTMPAVGGAKIFGCNGAAGPVLRINRSGSAELRGLAIEAKGSSCSSGSNFTESIRVDNVLPGSGPRGVTTTNLRFNALALSSSWGAQKVAGYVGLNVNKGENMEDIRIRDSMINCQYSSNSYGIRWAGGNADTGEIYHNNISACFQNIRQEAGQVAILLNKFGGGGTLNKFGVTGGASIYLRGCVGPETIAFNTSAEGSSQFINENDDHPGFSCNLILIGNNWGTDPTPGSIDPNKYPLNLVAGSNVLIGNRFTTFGMVNKATVGSDANGRAGPNAQLTAFNNTTDSRYFTQADQVGNSNAPFQFGQTVDGDSSLDHLLFPRGFGSWELGGPRSPTVSLESAAFFDGKPQRDRYSFVNVASGVHDQTASTFVVTHPRGVSNPYVAIEPPLIGGLRTAAIPALPKLHQILAVGARGSTKWGYKAVGVGANGTTAATPELVYETGPATLTASNYNQVWITPTVGVIYYNVYRTTASGTPNTTGYIGKVYVTDAYAGPTSENILWFNDMGLRGDGTTPPTVSTADGSLDLSGGILFIDDNAKDIGVAAAHRPRTGYFGTSVVTPRLAGITDSTELARLNAGLWHGKTAIDFSGKLNFGSLAQGSCAEKTLVVPGAVIEDAIAPAWPSTLEPGLFGMMIVSAADTVKVRLCNLTGSSVDSATQVFGGRVVK